MDVVEGLLDAKGGRFAIVASRFNHPITKRLVEGACDCLRRHNVEPKVLYWVPGAFEIPLVAKQLASTGEYDAIICVGAIIRGETPHFDYVCAQVSSGIMQANLQTGVPIIFSVLTTDTVEQAEARSGIKGNNNGFHGALTAMEMFQVMQRIPQGASCDLNL